MIIAVASQDGNVSPRFGDTPEFTLYETRGGELLGPRVISTRRIGRGSLTGILDAVGAELLICGEISGREQRELEEIGVAVAVGVSGGVDAAVKKHFAEKGRG